MWEGERSGTICENKRDLRRACVSGKDAAPGVGKMLLLFIIPVTVGEFDNTVKSVSDLGRIAGESEVGDQRPEGQKSEVGG